MVTAGIKTLLNVPAITLDLVAVVDVSHSMAGEKIDSVKQSLRFILGCLSMVDRLAIVKFNSRAQVLAPFLRCTSEIISGVGGVRSKDRLLSAIDSLAECSGGTNIFKGLDAALKLIAGRRQKNNACAILFLSDGQDSAGFKSYSSIVSRATELDTTIFTFGYGLDHDATMLLGLAGKTGTFTFIRNVDMVQDAFSGCIGGVKSTMFQDVVVTLSALQVGRVEITKINCSYDSDIMASRRLSTIQFGNIFNGESRDAIVHLEVSDYAGISSLGSSTLALLQANCSFTISRSGRIISELPEATEPLIVSFHSGSSERPPGVKPDSMIVRQRLRIMALEGIRASIEMADNGGMEDARKKMVETRCAVIESISEAVSVSAEELGEKLPTLLRPNGRFFPNYTLTTHPCPSIVSDLNDWVFWLAVLEDIDRATLRYSGPRNGLQRAGAMASQRALLSTYSTQRTVFNSPMYTENNGGSALGQQLQSPMSRSYQFTSSFNGIV
ncbi:hypothetical protein HDU67_008279 [Dinochytrium kinnereticum]|nr:hypothetical protein HDU67_008279 [Dinochytrium kinnereticum]